MMVSRSGVDLQSEARLPRELSERVACARSDRPGADILSADYASLSHRLEIPIDMVEIPREPDVEHVAFFVTTGVEVAGVVLLVEGVVGGQFVRPEDLPLDPERVEAEMAVRRVVERMLEIVLHRLAQESDEAPRAALPVAPHGIERLPHVGTVAGRDETLQVEVEILPSDPRLEGPGLGRVDVGEKSEPQVERVLVDRRGDVLAEGAVVFELEEQLPVLVEMDIRVELQSLDDVVVALRAAHAKSGGVDVFEPLPQRRAERDVALGIPGHDGDVFDGVERLGA